MTANRETGSETWHWGKLLRNTDGVKDWTLVELAPNGLPLRTLAGGLTETLVDAIIADHNRAKATGDLVKALETRCSYCAEGHEPVRTPEYDLVWVHARPGGWEMCGLDADIRQALAAFKESQHDHGK